MAIRTASMVNYLKQKQKDASEGPGISLGNTGNSARIYDSAPNGVTGNARSSGVPKAVTQGVDMSGGSSQIWDIVPEGSSSSGKAQPARVFDPGGIPRDVTTTGGAEAPYFRPGESASSGSASSSFQSSSGSSSGASLPSKPVRRSFEAPEKPTLSQWVMPDMPERREYVKPAPYEVPEYTKPAVFQRQAFVPGETTQEYFQKMQQTEGAEPGPFTSRYDGAIQDILDGILNGGTYDVTKDPNYAMLYDQMRQSQMAAGDRAMRDAMGAMQGASGGYGSTAALAAGTQAYDQYLQGMNDNSTSLMQLAYQMWRDGRGDEYNRLNALTGLDNTDYARHRDTYNDWANNRAYYANQYQGMYDRDRSAYEYDTGLDWAQWQDSANRDWTQWQDQADRGWMQWQDQADRDWTQYQYDTDMDWDRYQYGTNLSYDQWRYNQDRQWDEYMSDLDTAMQQYQMDYNRDWDEYMSDLDSYNRAQEMDWDRYQYENNLAYQRERDEVEDYETALDSALGLAGSGISVPELYSGRFDDATTTQLNALAAQALAQRDAEANARLLKLSGGGSGGSGGSGGGRRSSGGSRKKSKGKGEGTGTTGRRLFFEENELSAVPERQMTQDVFNAQRDAVYDAALSEAESQGMSGDDAAEYASGVRKDFMEYLMDEGYQVAHHRYSTTPR